MGTTKTWELRTNKGDGSVMIVASYYEEQTVVFTLGGFLWTYCNSELVMAGSTFHFQLSESDGKCMDEMLANFRDPTQGINPWIKKMDFGQMLHDRLEKRTTFAGLFPAGEKKLAEMEAEVMRLQKELDSLRQRWSVFALEDGPGGGAWVTMDVRCPDCEAEAKVEVQAPEKKEEESDGKGRSDSDR